jgi:hypothetical protein
MENNRTPSPLTLQQPQTPTPLDSHGHDPSAYDWVPVLRKPRTDGWSPDRQRTFIEILADSGSASFAAQSVGMTVRSAQKLRRSPGAEGFDRAWTAAINASASLLLDEAFERALVGSDEPVWGRDGKVIGRRFRKSDAMLQFMLRSYFPERFGGGGVDMQLPASPSHPPASVAQAITEMLPEPPADPAALLSDEALEDALEIADILEGQLPAKARAWERELTPPVVAPLGAQFERDLENAKRANSGLEPIDDEEWLEFAAAHRIENPRSAKR